MDDPKPEQSIHPTLSDDAKAARRPSQIETRLQELLTAEARLADLESWLLEEYNATLEIWKSLSEPAGRAAMYNSMQTIAAVARHLLTGRDDVVPLFNERLIVFTQHQNIRDWSKGGG